MNILDQLPEDIGLEFLDNQRLMLMWLRLRYKSEMQRSKWRNRIFISKLKSREYPC